MANLGQLAPSVRVHGDDGNRARQGGEPAIHAALLLFEADLATRPIARQVLVTLIPASRNGLNERLASFFGIAMARRREKSELAKAAGQKMLYRETCTLGFVSQYGAYTIQLIVDVVDVHDRQPLLAQLLHLEAAGNSGDDAVATPTVRNR